jgi:hypothetical protein
MSPSSFPQMTAAILATALAMTPPPSAPAPATPPLAPATAALHLAGAAPLHTRLAPETPGCETTGLVGRMRVPRQIAEWRVSGGDKSQGPQPRLANPLAAPQTVRPAMHMCMVDHFDPQDMSGAHKVIYRL